MRVNWFAPLPPAPAAAVSYTAWLLPALVAQADVTLWTDQAEWDRRLEALAPIRRFDPEAPPWAEWNAADLSIYHLSDDPAEGGILAACRAHPGIVLLPGNSEDDGRHALGVVVQDLETFARLKEADRRPLLYLPPPGPDAAEAHAGALLRFAAEACSFRGALVAQDLARQVAAEVSLWGTAVASPPWLQAIAQEIYGLTTAPQETRHGPARAA
jgi:hypothetical protein